MSRWFRHYAGMMRDDKLVRVAIQTKQAVERVLWVWGAVLESAAEVNDGGRFDIDTAEIAYFLRSDQADIEAIFEALSAINRLAGDRVVNWGARQFESDRSATRQAAYRERKRAKSVLADTEQPSPDAVVTSPSRHSDAPETETETETEKKKDSRRVARATTPDVEFEEFWKGYPKRDGDNPKAPARKAFAAAVRGGADPKAIVAGLKVAAARNSDKVGTKYIPQAVKWLHDRRWEDYAQAVEPEADQPVNWDQILSTFKQFGRWPSSGYGGQPGMVSCRVPEDVLRKHGYGSDPPNGRVPENVSRETKHTEAA
jgi:hypothetical protein